jgi:hypothetical protein
MVMKIQWTTGDMKKVKCNNYEIRKVKRFKYLGIKIITNGRV